MARQPMLSDALRQSAALSRCRGCVSSWLRPTQQRSITWGASTRQAAVQQASHGHVGGSLSTHPLCLLRSSKLKASLCVGHRLTKRAACQHEHCEDCSRASLPDIASGRRWTAAVWLRWKQQSRGRDPKGWCWQESGSEGRARSAAAYRFWQNAAAFGLRCGPGASGSPAAGLLHRRPVWRCAHLCTAHLAAKAAAVAVVLGLRERAQPDTLQGIARPALGRA
mmetsp:Transcript_67558/g.178175  ORF Transcript_67558/g.178175 Transcript_67558/m.178175 type:complete len:223 (+) Transcript_67558:449-1117(+)